MRRNEAQFTLALRLLLKQCAFLCLLIWPFCNVALAQSITLQLLNGKNGKPITKVKVYISFPGDRVRKAIELTTDHRGKVQFDACGSKIFQVHQIGYATCDEQPVGSQPRAYPVDKIFETSQVSANDCGSTRVQSEPGRLVFFVRHGTWGEWLKQ